MCNTCFAFGPVSEMPRIITFADAAQENNEVSAIEKWNTRFHKPLYGNAAVRAIENKTELPLDKSSGVQA